MYCTRLVISILQNNCYSKFLKLLENNVNFLKQNYFIKKQNICSANKTKSPYSKTDHSVLLINIMFLYKDFSILKVHINSIPSLTISKSFYFKRYYYMSRYLKVLYEAQNHARINSRNKPIGIFK